jgi:Uncharacterized protein conserved in bacteria (DUF2252)
VLTDVSVPLRCTPSRRTDSASTTRRATCGSGRSGDPVAVARYLADGDTFDRPITDFSSRYADQNEQDFQEFVRAIRAGRLQATEGV